LALRAWYCVHSFPTNQSINHRYHALTGKDSDGIYPTKINRFTGSASGVYTFGGLSDSFYE
jgi:hypothetical protein